MNFITPKKTLLVIANAAFAKIFHQNKQQLQLMHDLSHKESTYKKQEIMADESGRYQKSASVSQGVYEPHTDPKEVEALKFASNLSELLAANHSDYDEILIIAPGHFQHLLKKKFKKETLNKISQYFDKDYLKLGIKELEDHVKELTRLK